MSAVVECRHGLDEDTCSTCKHGVARPVMREADYVTVARFEGHCTGCNLPIYVGQTIASFHGRFVHQGCL